MSEDYAIQLSTKFGQYDQNMLNVRAKTEQEFNALLQHIIHNAGTIVLAADTVRATAVDGGTVPANPNPPATNYQPAQVPQSAPQWAQPAQARPVSQPQQHPNCAHGPMTWLTGVSKKNGKPWSGWFCPAPQDQPRCAPQFA